MFIRKKSGQGPTWARVVSSLLTPGLIALGAGPAVAQGPVATSNCPGGAPCDRRTGRTPCAAPGGPASAHSGSSAAGRNSARGSAGCGASRRAGHRAELRLGVPPATVSTEELSPEELAALEKKDLDIVKVTVDRREKSIQNLRRFGVGLFAGRSGSRRRHQPAPARQPQTPYPGIGDAGGQHRVYIRGIGSSDNTELGDPATATYFGNVYIPRPRGVGSMFFDLDRVEVNRGPQGTCAAAMPRPRSINLIPALPRMDELQAMGDILVGNYYDPITKAMINVPLAPHLALSVLATFSDNHNPYYHQRGAGLRRSPRRRAPTYLSGRASLLWDAGPPPSEPLLVARAGPTRGGTGYTGTNYAPALQAGTLAERGSGSAQRDLPPPASRREHAPFRHRWDVKLGPGPRAGRAHQQLPGHGLLPDHGRKRRGGFPGHERPQIDNWSTSYWHTSSKSTVQELRIFAPDTARRCAAPGPSTSRRCASTRCSSCRSAGQACPGRRRRRCRPSSACS